MAHHGDFYERALLYDVAFGFKDVPRECDVLADLCRTVVGRPPLSFLELAAGPACHAREFARRGLRSTALDLSEAMAAYGRAEAAEGAPFTYVVADMTDFRLTPPVDLAAILMDSTAYLLDNDQVLRHLAAVADALVDGGCYVLEMSHPRDVYRVGTSAGTSWDAAGRGYEVHVDWGAPDDVFDPTTGVTGTSVTLTWRSTDGGGEGVIRDVAPQRCFTPNEFFALVTASGRFAVATVLGAMDPAVPFDAAPRAWRMVSVRRLHRAAARAAPTTLRISATAPRPRPLLLRNPSPAPDAAARASSRPGPTAGRRNPSRTGFPAWPAVPSPP